MSGGNWPAIPQALFNRRGTYIRVSEKTGEDGKRAETAVCNVMFVYREGTQYYEEKSGSRVICGGAAYCQGDIDPSGAPVNGRIEWEDGRKSKIVKGIREYNPGGTVNHSKVVLE